MRLGFAYNPRRVADSARGDRIQPIDDTTVPSLDEPVCVLLCGLLPRPAVFPLEAPRRFHILAAKVAVKVRASVGSFHLVPLDLVQGKVRQVQLQDPDLGAVLEEEAQRDGDLSG